jgi:hypothetical protein
MPADRKGRDEGEYGARCDDDDGRKRCQGGGMLALERDIWDARVRVL